MLWTHGVGNEKVLEMDAVSKPLHTIQIVCNGHAIRDEIIFSRHHSCGNNYHSRGKSRIRLM